MSGLPTGSPAMPTSALTYDSHRSGSNFRLDPLLSERDGLGTGRTCACSSTFCIARVRADMRNKNADGAF